MHIAYNEPSSNDYYCLHTIVTSTAYKAFKLHVVTKLKLTLFSWENID